MATYKKRGAKKSVTTSKENEETLESTTAEVFETLDTTASKTEEWVVKYQNIILTFIGLIALSVLGYLGYNSYLVVPKEREAVSELNQAQYYFDLAVNSVEADSLYSRALNGGEGKYGFLDIIENYKDKYEFPEGYKELFNKSYEIFVMYRDKLNVEELSIIKSNRDIGGLIQFLVKDIEMNELRVQNGVKKIMNTLNG